MATKALTNELIYPSNNDVNGGVAGAGKNLQESKFIKVIDALLSEGNIISGGGMSGAGTATLNIDSGAAIISGRYLSWNADSITSLPASQTVHVFLKLDITNENVTGASIEDNTTGTPPADSLKLCQLTTNGSSVITAITDCRLLDHKRRIPNIATFTGSPGTFIFKSNRTYIEIWGASGGGGGGGGGGGSDGTSYGLCGGNGGPGGAGQYYFTITTATPGTSATVTPGAGGTAGAGGSGGSGTSGTGNDGTDGGAGGTTTVGVLATVTGGAGGKAGKGGINHFQNDARVVNLQMASGAGGNYASGAVHGAGQAGGAGGAGGAGSSTSGTAGSNGQAGQGAYILMWW